MRVLCFLAVLASWEAFATSRICNKDNYCGAYSELQNPKEINEVKSCLQSKAMVCKLAAAQKVVYGNFCGWGNKAVESGLRAWIKRQIEGQLTCLDGSKDVTSCVTRLEPINDGGLDEMCKSHDLCWISNKDIENRKERRAVYCQCDEVLVVNLMDYANAPFMEPTRREMALMLAQGMKTYSNKFAGCQIQINTDWLKP